MHPNGQFPAYEWAFGDVNPPVHAWACWRVYKIDQPQDGVGIDRFSGAGLSEIAVEFYLVGQSERRSRTRTSFPGGFWGWTISVFSIAPNRCRTADPWNKPTVPPGWRFTVPTCCRSRLNWPQRSGLRGHRLQVFRTLHRHQRRYSYHRRQWPLG